MKKLLLALSALSCIAAANAGSSSAILNLTATVQAACYSSLSTSNLNWTFIPGQLPAAQTTALDLQCSAGTAVNGLTAASANGWQFLGASSANTLAYTLTSTGVNAPYAAQAGNFVSGQWSGVTGSTLAQSELTSPVTIDANASLLQVNLSVQPATVPSTLAVDNYADSVTFTTAF